MIRERPWDRKEFWEWYNRVTSKYPISCRECKEERKKMWFTNDYDGSMLRWYYKAFWGIDIGEEPSNKDRGE